MITAVDTNVLLDVLLPDDVHGPQSREWLSLAYEQGELVVCDIVYAEMAPRFNTQRELEEALTTIGAQVTAIDTAIAWEAGTRWGRYRRAGGPRQRILADFLIGAHATVTADALLTRDEGFYSSYFPELGSSASS